MSLLPHRADSREILAIGGPAILGLSSQLIVSVVDTAMVGRLDNASIALAAMGLGMLATWAITSFFSSLSTGTHVLVARRYGEGKPVSAGEVLNNSLVVCFLIGLVVAAAGYLITPAVLSFFAKDMAVAAVGTPYMRYRFIGLPFFLLVVSYRGFFYGIGQTKVFMYSAIIVNVTNIILDYLLIFGAMGFPRMELAGAGLASTIATLIGCLFFMAVTVLKTYRTTFHYFSRMRFAKNVIRQIVNISLPVSFQNLLILLGFLSFVAITGIIGTTEQAASQVVITALFLSFLPCFGLGIAAQTLVGQMLGRSLPERARAYGFATAKLATLFTIGVGALFVLLPDVVLIVITTNRSVIQVAHPILQIAGAAQVVYGSGIIYANALQAAGETLYVMIVEVITHWVLFLPCAFLFGITFGGGILGAWLALPVYVGLYTLLNFLKFRSTSLMAMRI